MLLEISSRALEPFLEIYATDVGRGRLGNLNSRPPFVRNTVAEFTPRIEKGCYRGGERKHDIGYKGGRRRFRNSKAEFPSRYPPADLEFRARWYGIPFIKNIVPVGFFAGRAFISTAGNKIELFPRGRGETRGIEFKATLNQSSFNFPLNREKVFTGGGRCWTKTS